MIYVTHALNFFIPFRLCWHYIQKKHNQNHLLRWERIYRALFVIVIAIVAIVFPAINPLMGFVSISFIYIIQTQSVGFTALMTKTLPTTSHE